MSRVEAHRVVRLASGETPGEVRAREDAAQDLVRRVRCASSDMILAAIQDRVAEDPGFDAETLGDRIARLGWEQSRRRASPLLSRKESGDEFEH